MKVDITLNCSAKSFYDVIINSAIADIKQQTGSDVTLHVGYKYKKNLTRYNKTEIETVFEIISLVTNECYAYTVTTGVEVTTVSFEIIALSENQIRVLYSEMSQAESKRIGTSQSITGGIYSFFGGNRKMKKKLKAIESYIIANG